LTLRSFLAKRFVYTIVLVFFVIILNWVIFEAMPGVTGNLYDIVGARSQLSTKFYNKNVELYNLNASTWDQFTTYVHNLLTFQFGYSIHDNQQVTQELIQSGRLVNTLILIGLSTVLAIVIGIVLGIVVSNRRGSTIDNFLVSASLTTFALPSFFIGIMSIFVFTFTLHWFPDAGTIPTSWPTGNLPPWYEQILPRLQFLFLPVLTLTLITYGFFLLLTRASMMEVLNEDYVTTARAKGLSQRVILLRHAFKNASLPLVTASALSFGGILGGAIITEAIFNYAGLGRWLYDAIQYKDFPVMEAMFYIIALCVIVANFISDVIYGIIDPRIKYE
jgi:peptide/nickel transport system permease protein